MSTIGEFRKLLESYRDVKYDMGKRDIARLMTAPDKFGAFLLSCYETWDTKEKTLHQYTNRLKSSDITPKEVSPVIIGIANDLTELVAILRSLKNSIGPVTFEKVHEELTHKVSGTIGSYTTLFEVIVGDLPYDLRFSEKIVSNLKLQAVLGKWGNSSIKSTITQAMKKPLHSRKDDSRKSRSQITRAFLDFGNHIWVLVRLIYLIFFYSFVQSSLADSILSYDLWLKIPLWGLLLIWIIRAIRRGNFSIFISGLIIWGIALIWAYDFFPFWLFGNGEITRLLKVLLWLTVIFWFPVQFLNIFKDYRINQVILLSIIWSGVLSLFAYGIGKGLLVAFLLLIMPINRLLNAPKTEQRNFAGTLDKRLYIPTAISLMVVALFVTREGLWLIGAFIWIIFSITVSHSSKYFRRTYDLIEELYPNPQGRRRRHLLLFISLSLTTMTLFPGLLGKLSNEFVVNLYSQASGLAFGLITILLAVQAIIPGVTTWAGNTRKAHYLREMRSILRANAGLEGFMQWFFILFIYSLLAWLVTTHFLSNVRILVDLSQVNAFEQPINTFDEIRRLLLSNQEVSEEFLMRVSTIIFSVFVYVSIYGIAQLYYLFIAANTLTLPIRDSLLSSPVEIESINLESLQNGEDLVIKENTIRDKIRSDNELNGHIINQLYISYGPDNPNQIEKVKVDIELDFIEQQELHNFVKKVFTCMFGLGQVENVEVSIVRRTYQKFSRQPVFHLEIDLKEWNFLNKDLPGFPFDYKLQCLGARQPDYALAESQIA